MSKRKTLGPLSKALRATRVALHLRQVDLAERVRVPRATVSAWESGLSEPEQWQRIAIVRRLADAPSAILSRLADALHVAVPKSAPAGKAPEALLDAMAAAIGGAADEIGVPAPALRRTLAIVFRHMALAGVRLDEAAEVLRSAREPAPSKRR